MGTGVLS